MLLEGLFAWTFGYVSLTVHQQNYLSNGENIAPPLYFGSRLGGNLSSLALLLYYINNSSDEKYGYAFYIIFIDTLYTTGFYLYNISSYYYKNSLQYTFSVILLFCNILSFVYYEYLEYPSVMLLVSYLLGWSFLPFTSNCFKCYSNIALLSPEGPLSFPLHVYKLLTIIVGMCLLMVYDHNFSFFQSSYLYILLAGQIIEIAGLVWLLARKNPVIDNNIDYQNL